jgi:hypothetical protein
MTRAIEAGMLSSIAAQSGREILHLISIDLETVGVLCLCTAPHDVVWDGHTWEGIGGAIGFESITEVEDKKAGQVGIKVSGVDQTVLSALLTYNARGRAVEIYLAHLGTETGAIISDPILMFQGFANDGFRVDERRSERGQGTVDISVRAVDRAYYMGRSRGIECNTASHQRYYSGDTFFQHVPGLMNKTIEWAGTRSRGLAAFGLVPQGGG